MHVWVLKNSGYNLISSFFQKLDLTHTFGTYCIIMAESQNVGLAACISREKLVLLHRNVKSPQASTGINQ